MKKIFYILTAILAISSCTKGGLAVDTDEIEPVKEPTVYTATIEGTRTEIDETGKVSWVNGDEIVLTDGKTSAIYVATVDPESPTKATFNLKEGETEPEGPITGAKYGDVKNQTYDPQHLGSNCPMEAGEPENKNFHFKNTCGVLRISANSNGAVLKRIEVGKYTLNIDNKDITAATTFDIALPPATYSPLKIYFVNSNGRVCTKTYKKGGFVVSKNLISPLNFSAALSFDGYAPLPGEFEINENGDKVKFAPGNLYFEGDRTSGIGTWKLEENQYDCRTYYKQSSAFNGTFTIGSGTPKDTYGLIGWRWSIPTGNVQCLPTVSNQPTLTAFNDWGNDVPGYMWMTLSHEEVQYILDNYKHAISKINNSVNGIVFLPEKNNEGSTTIKTNYTLDEWNDAEAQGAVFLPASGFISGNSTSVDKANQWCEYWVNDYSVYDYFPNSKLWHFNTQSSGGILQEASSNLQAFSVRLVTRVEQ